MIDTSMHQYHVLLRDVMRLGYVQDNRTDQWAKTLPYGSIMRFDMNNGFPAPWSKELYFPGIRGEIVGFLRGYTNSADFAAIGCKWWDKDANTNADWLKSPFRKGPGDMGKAYGYQWRHWEAHTLHEYENTADEPLFTVVDESIDQVQVVLDMIRNDPYSRRIVLSAWRPDHFAEMCLPPCHVLYRFQVNVAAGELNMSFYQRSSDMFLGVPMNIAGAALLLHLVAAATGLKPRWLTHHLDDTHIYNKAFDAVAEQLAIADQGVPRPYPTLILGQNLFGADADALAAVDHTKIVLDGYHPYRLKSDKVPMATTTVKGSNA